MRLDPSSPVPLYHQIAEALRYRIATGRLAPGATLPPVRQAAADWKVNLHTVRKAYAELVSDGLAASGGRRGTVILEGRAGKVQPDRLAAFVDRMLREAEKKFGLDRWGLAHLLAEGHGAGSQHRGHVHVVECSESQCLDHVHEIENAWEVSARPWSLSRDGEPPPGTVIATYFHYNEIRRRWPQRFREVHFTAISPDPGIAARIPASRSRRQPLRLVELDQGAALSIAADLSVIFDPERFQIETVLLGDEGSLPVSARGAPLLYSPRTWARLDAEQQANPRTHKILYRFSPEDLEHLGQLFHWKRRIPVPQPA